MELCRFGGSALATSSFVFPDTGNYTISLIVGANTICPDTTNLGIYLPLEGMDITLPNLTVCRGDSVWVKATDLLADFSQSSTYSWTPTGQILQGQGIDSVLVVVNNSLQLQVNGLNNNGCRDTTTTIIEIEETIAEFDSTVANCNTNLLVQFNNNTSSSLSNAFYQWNFGGLGNATAANPNFTFPDTGTYTITLVAGFGALCPDTLTKNIDVRREGVILSPTASQDICQVDETGISAVNIYEGYSAFTNYNWPPGGFILAGQGTDSITFLGNTTTTLQVIATNSYNCSDTTSVQINVVEVEAAFDTVDIACNTVLTIPFRNNSTTN